VITAALGGASATVGLSGAIPPATATARSAPSGAGELSVAEIGSFAAKAGFSGTALAMAIAVALAESNGNPTRPTSTATGRSIAASGRSTLSTRSSRLPVTTARCARRRRPFRSRPAGPTGSVGHLSAGRGDPIPSRSDRVCRKRRFSAMSSLGRSRRTAKEEFVDTRSRTARAVLLGSKRAAESNPLRAAALDYAKRGGRCCPCARATRRRTVCSCRMD